MSVFPPDTNNTTDAADVENRKNPASPGRLHGSKELAVDAVRETTNLVQKTHRATSDKVFRRIDAMAPGPVASIAKIVRVIHDGTSTGVYSAIRGGSFGVGKLMDLARAFKSNKPEASPPAGASGKAGKAGKAAKLADNAQAALNGFYGDYLEQRNNSLALEMNFRKDGRVLPLDTDAFRTAYPNASGKLCVFVHGLSCTEWSWNVSAEKFHGDPDTNFGTLLEKDLGYTPLFIRYNSGLHISENSRLLAELMQNLMRVYPQEPSSIVLVGHSMGGLVARGAAALAASHTSSDESWTKKLRHVFCIGSPHLGAPLEKAVNLLTNALGAFDTAGTQVPAQVLNTRSAGVKDLRFGYTLESEWANQDPDALLEDGREAAAFVEGVDYYFIAGTITRDAKNPMGVLLGDLMVRLPSATGHAPDASRRIPFKEGRIFRGMNHLHLANHPDVYAAVREWLVK